MSTVAEIEAAIEKLSPGQVREIAAWLEARQEKTSVQAEGNLPLFGFWKGNIVFNDGWDEPLEDFQEYME